MTYDPYQIHSAMGAFPGATTPFQSPYTALNPLAVFNPLAAAYPPIAGGGINPQQLQQQLQLAQILAARAGLPQLLAASPWTSFVNPLLAAAVLQNPLAATGLENPFVNPLVHPLAAHSQVGTQPYPFYPQIVQIPTQYGQIPPQFGQIPTQFGQIQPQFGQIGPMLAPQSWVGQHGLYGNPALGPVHPLVSQLAGRGFHGAGISPWTGY